MKKLSIFLAVALLATIKLNGQNIDDLKLSENEIPNGYYLTDNNNCITMQADMFYDNPKLFEGIIGKVKNKDVQNFDSEKDKGCIMYFEFENDFIREDFIRSYVWGDKKPTKEHPEQFYSKGKFLIIFSFHKNSLIAEKSKEKIKKILE